MSDVILLVDDERDYVMMLEMALRAEGFECLIAYDGAQGLEMAQEHEIDMLISDVNMPGLDGFSLCKRLREQSPTLPIILLTSRESEIDEALGLGLGADDYIVKPVRNRVLLARVRALLRRIRHGAMVEELEKPEDVLHVDELCLNATRLLVTWCGEPIAGITVVQFRLLWKLATSPGRVFSRPQLLAAMRQDDETFVSERMVDAYANRLRRHLDASGCVRVGINTVTGLGYRLIITEEVSR